VALGDDHGSFKFTPEPLAYTPALSGVAEISGNLLTRSSQLDSVATVLAAGLH
jgi:hypothetical protein